jgi:hypothetical protein
VEFASGGRASLNDVTLVIRHGSRLPYTTLIIFELTSVKAGGSVYDIALVMRSVSINHRELKTKKAFVRQCLLRRQPVVH